MSAFAETARRAGARTLSDATRRLLDLPTDYGSIFLRVGRPIIRRIEWDSTEEGSPHKPQVVAAATVSAVIGLASGAAAHQLAAGTVGVAASAALREERRRSTRRIQGESSTRRIQGERSQGGWWRIPPGGAEPSQQTSAPSTGSGAEPGSAVPDAAGSSSAEVSAEFARAATGYDELTHTVEDVTARLESELYAEAQRILWVLASAVDLFNDAATSTPGVQGDFANLCCPNQREIWPADFAGAAAKVAADLAALRQRTSDFGGAAAKVAADLAALRQHVSEAAAAADQVASPATWLTGGTEGTAPPVASPAPVTADSSPRRTDGGRTGGAATRPGGPCPRRIRSDGAD